MPIASFLDYLKSERNRSEHTIYNYGVALKEFQSFFKSLGQGIEWETVDSSTVREWIIFMMDEQDMKPSTVNLYLSGLRSFYRYMLSTGRVKKNPLLNVSGPKSSKHLPAFIKEEDMDRLLDSGQYSDDFQGHRDHLILSMLYSTGMRRAEILGLEDKDVLLSERTLKVTGKRNKQRLIPISDALATEIRDYTSLRDEEFGDRRKSQHLFLGDKGKAMRPDEIHRIVTENLSLVTSQQRRSPHVLRHSFATAMLNNGAGLESIQKLLGHESLETTQIYTHLSFEELKKEYNNAHPRS